MSAAKRRTSAAPRGPRVTSEGLSCHVSGNSDTSLTKGELADRLRNSGYAYDAAGRTTVVPATDALGEGSHASDSERREQASRYDDVVGRRLNNPALADLVLAGLANDSLPRRVLRPAG